MLFNQMVKHVFELHFHLIMLTLTVYKLYIVSERWL